MCYAKLNCCYTCYDLICNEPICDICLYSRQYTVTQYPDLKPITHLLWGKHYKSKVKTLQGGQNRITEIEVQRKMDIDSDLLLGDACPYCTTNRHDDAVEQKVCYICYFHVYVFTYFSSYLLLIYIIRNYFVYLQDFFNLNMSAIL